MLGASENENENISGIMSNDALNVIMQEFKQENMDSLFEDVLQMQASPNLQQVEEYGVSFEEVLSNNSIPLELEENSTSNLDEFKQSYFPPNQPLNICNEDYAGAYDFETCIEPTDTKTPWEFSTQLNRIYIDLNKSFPVRFSVKNRPHDQKLFIRVTPVFIEPQHAQELVHRCISHEYAGDSSNKDIPPHVVQHVIRSDNPNTEYFGSKENNMRLNLVLPLAHPQPGVGHVKEFFRFVCKTSCVNGMNRRPIEVIFTLEDDNGEVHGRNILRVKICSCPKRDREKDEEKKNVPYFPRGKKRKTDNRAPLVPAQNGKDEQVFNVSFNIVGESNFKSILKMAKGLMASEIVERKETADSSIYKQCFDDICTKLKSL